MRAGAVAGIVVLGVFGVGCSDSPVKVPYVATATTAMGDAGLDDSGSAALPDPCEVLTTEEVQAFVIAASGPYFEVSGLTAPSAPVEGTCQWSFQQGSTGGTPIDDIFTVSLWSGTQYETGTVCENVAKESSVASTMTAFVSSADCAFASFGGGVVVVGNVVAWWNMGGGIDSTTSPGANAELAAALVAGLAG